MELKVEVDFVSDSVVLNLSWERKKKKLMLQMSGNTEKNVTNIF